MLRSVAGLLVVFVGALQAGWAADQRPNIVFIFADDQCFDTINSLGNKEIETPNADVVSDSAALDTDKHRSEPNLDVLADLMAQEQPV